jgi:hypothetical protein
MKIFQLVSENLTHLGGNMGTEYTYPNYTKFFSSIEFAKKHAEKEYKGIIKWSKRGDTISSGDLGHVMYLITPVKIER